MTFDPEPKHRPKSPVVTMHEDDPILSRKYPTVFNRRNMRLALGFFAGVTLILVVLNQYQVARERADRIHDTDQKFHDFACLLVKQYPDTVSQLVKEVRAQFHCGPYVKPKESEPKTSPSPRGSAGTATKHNGMPGLPHKSSSFGSPSPVAHTTGLSSTRTVTIGPSRPPISTPRPSDTPSPTPTQTRPIASPTPEPILSGILCKPLQICVTLPIALTSLLALKGG